MIQQWIDLEIDNLITEKQKLVLDEHLITCEECREYQLEAKRLHVQLLSQFDTMETELKTSTIMRQIKPRKKSWLIVASLLVVLSFTFNNQLYALASELPLFADLLEYFSKDDGIDYAKEHGYPVHDMMFEEDGVIIFIKDFYVDKNSARYQYAVQIDGEFVVPDEFVMKSENYSFESAPRSGLFISEKKPWIEVTLAPKIDVLEGDNFFDITIFVKGIEYSLNGVEIIYEKEEYEVKYIDINQTVDTPGGSIEFAMLEVHPGNMFLHINSGEGTRFSNFKITTDNGDVIEFSHRIHHEEDELNHQYEFRPSIYYDDISEITIEFNYDPPTHKPLGQIDFETLTLDLDPEEFIDDKSKELNIKYNTTNEKYELENVVFDETSVTFDVICDELLYQSVFPDLKIKKDNKYVLLETAKPSSEYEQYVKVPYYFLVEWFGDNIDKLKLEPQESLLDEYWLHGKHMVYSLGDLKDLLDQYSVKSVDLDMYFKDKDFYVSLEEIEKVLGIEFDTSDVLWNQLELEDKVKLQMYFYEEYSIINIFMDLLSSRVTGTSEGVQKTSKSLFMYYKTIYTIARTDERVEVYLENHRLQEPFIIKVPIRNN